MKKITTAAGGVGRVLESGRGAPVKISASARRTVAEIYHLTSRLIDLPYKGSEGQRTRSRMICACIDLVAALDKCNRGKDRGAR